MTAKTLHRVKKGRGTGINPVPRFGESARERVDDGWQQTEEQALVTEVLVDTSRTIITYNKSPDVPFDRSINPYKGCEHGCVYCFARPTHAYLDLSPGLDFESRIFAKPDAPELLARELARSGYRPAPIALGVNTDAYQPVERKLRITRGVLDVLEAHQHPVAIVTKSSLIERDIDLLGPMAERGLVKVMVSVTSLDRGLSRRMEPRAAAPERRLQTIKTLSGAGIPVGVLFAPLIPALNDSEMEAVVKAVAAVGAESAAYVMLRLPFEVKDLFQNWLVEHYPLKAEHVMSIIYNLRDGRANSARFGERMTGTGEYARLMAQRFELACKAAGLNRVESGLDSSRFTVPVKSGDQLSLL
jgi:DNA repair photolyase